MDAQVRVWPTAAIADAHLHSHHLLLCGMGACGPALPALSPAFSAATAAVSEYGVAGALRFEVQDDMQEGTSLLAESASGDPLQVAFAVSVAALV